MNREPITVSEARTILLSDEAVAVRARFILHVDQADARRWLEITMPTHHIRQPEVPPAPPVVWTCVPPEFRGRTVLASETLDLGRFGPPIIDFGEAKFRRGSGRRVDGRATWHGRLDYARTQAAYREWDEACRQIRHAHDLEVKQMWRDHEAALFRALEPHVILMVSKNGTSVRRVVPTQVYPFGQMTLVPGYASFSADLEYEGAFPAEYVDAYYKPVKPPR